MSTGVYPEKDAPPERSRQSLQRRHDGWRRAELVDLLDGMSNMEFMLRFTLSHPAMNTMIVGTTNPDHLADNLAAAQKGVLPDDLYQAARERLDKRTI